jgi:exonuclease VII small subunit
MTKILPALLVLALSGCGLETATTAATVGVAKKHEAEQGKKTMQQAQQKIDQAVAQTQKHAQDIDEEKR